MAIHLVKNVSQKRSAHWPEFVYLLYTFYIKNTLERLECTYPQMQVFELAFKQLPGWGITQAVIVTQNVDLSDEIPATAQTNQYRAPDKMCPAHSPRCTRPSVTALLEVSL